MASLAINEVRSKLSSFIQSLDSGASAKDIAAAFRKGHAESLKKASFELETMALIKLINEVGKRVSSGSPGQPDLFAGFSVPRNIVLPVSGEGTKRIHISTAKATLNDIDTWLAHHTKPRAVTSAEAIEMQRMMDAITHLECSRDSTVEDALRILKEEQDRKIA